MPSRRRRTGIRPLKIPIRLTSYRPVPNQPPASIPTSLKSSAHSVPSTPLRSSRRLDVRESTPTAVLVTTDQLSLTLPIPPSINKHYATVNGRRLLSSAGRVYKAQVGRHLWLALAQSPARLSLMERLRSGPLAFSVRFFFTTALRRDLDSGLKITQDAICEGLGLNDNRIVETHLYKTVDKTNPRVEASLSLAADSFQPHTVPH
jgi:crossover junction endodeoxyribonuclease RusA